MKIAAKLSLAILASIAALAVAQPVFAQAARRFPQPIAAGALVGRTVLQPLESQPVLGTVKAIVQGPDGMVQAVLRYGGLLGLGGRLIAVPLQAMTLLGERMEVVDFTPQQLDRFPSFDLASAENVPPQTILHVGLSKPSH